MSMTSEGLPARAANGELAHVDAAQVRAMIAADQALSLKEFALGFGYPYYTAKLIAREEGFPIFHGRIAPSDFRLWRRRRLGLQSAPDAPARPRRPVAGKSDVPPLKHG